MGWHVCHSRWSSSARRCFSTRSAKACNRGELSGRLQEHMTLVLRNIASRCARALLWSLAPPLSRAVQLGVASCGAGKGGRCHHGCADCVRPLQPQEPIHIVTAEMGISCARRSGTESQNESAKCITVLKEMEILRKYAFSWIQFSIQADFFSAIKTHTCTLTGTTYPYSYGILMHISGMDPFRNALRFYSLIQTDLNYLKLESNRGSS